MSKKITCGIILESKEGWLALLPYGKKDEAGRYDLPKGCCEVGEDPLDCAVRELKEETGIVLSDDEVASLNDLGQHYYLPEKDIHLFYLHTNNYCNHKFECSSLFESNYSWSKGEMVPEMVKMVWTKDFKIFMKCLQDVFEEVLPMISIY